MFWSQHPLNSVSVLCPFKCKWTTANLAPPLLPVPSMAHIMQISKLMTSLLDNQGNSLKQHVDFNLRNLKITKVFFNSQILGATQNMSKSLQQSTKQSIHVSLEWTSNEREKTFPTLKSFISIHLFWATPFQTWCEHNWKKPWLMSAVNCNN